MAANDNTNEYPTIRGPHGGPFVSPEDTARSVHERVDAFFAKLRPLNSGAPFLNPVDTE